jgi:UDP-N-acetylmuramate--alanine ligase
MNIYFSGIGGVGIGPLAEIAYDAGYDVQGSDTRESLLTYELQKRGIPIDLQQDGLFLKASHTAKPLDWFVYTSALPDTHPELALARQLGIKTTKRDELLAHIIAEKKLNLIAIAGTHGKTTTTSMLIWACKQLNIPISYSVGTALSFGPSGTFDPASEYFIYECDEFDRNFLHFSPHLALLTSIDYDHSDTYPRETDYINAFTQFIAQSEAIIMWQADNSSTGATADDGWILKDNEVCNVTLAGAHNRRNATLALKAIEYLRLAARDASMQALDHFPGSSRRFEHLANNLYTDYGHHPVEIAATLQLARELSDHVALVYQPHQNTRQHEIRHQYTDCFTQAEQVYWLPTYLSREDPNLPILRPEELYSQVSNKAAVRAAELNDDLWDAISHDRDNGRLVLGMGAGDIDTWLRKQNDIQRVANVLVIDQVGNIILQKRDDRPGINNPGMITGFGGGAMADETSRQTAARELREETNLSFETTQLAYHKTLFQPLVNDGASRWVTYYLLKDADISALEIYEGQGYAAISPTDDLDAYNLSPLARRAIEAYRKR